jgi:hypothetical protein
MSVGCDHFGAQGRGVRHGTAVQASVGPPQSVPPGSHPRQSVGGLLRLKTQWKRFVMTARAVLAILYGTHVDWIQLLTTVRAHVVEELPPSSPASALHDFWWASAAVALSSANWQLLHEYPRGCRVDCRGDYSDCALHDKYGATGLTFISGGIVFAQPLQRICDGSECP